MSVVGHQGSPEGREEAVDSKLFWSLCLGTFYSRLLRARKRRRGREGTLEVRQAQCPPGTLESDLLPSLVLGRQEGGHCQAFLVAWFPSHQLPMD